MGCCNRERVFRFESYWRNRVHSRFGDVMDARRRRRVATQGAPVRNGTRNILVLGDIHIGSIYGLLPPDFVSSDGAEKPQNEGQKYLWECWQDMKRRTAKFAIGSVVINGDLIEG